jgi:transcription antitermination factor NusG
MDRWYALHVRSNCESIVRNALDRIQVEAFYPHFQVQGKKQLIERTLMPGYVLGRFDLLARAPVISIPQIVRIIGFGLVPSPIPDFEVASVRQMTESPLTNATPHPYVAAGDTVVVMRGPLRGLEGFVIREKNETRVVVSIHMLQRSLAVTMDMDAVRVLQPALKQAA